MLWWRASRTNKYKVNFMHFPFLQVNSEANCSQWLKGIESIKDNCAYSPRICSEALFGERIIKQSEVTESSGGCLFLETCWHFSATTSMLGSATPPSTRGAASSQLFPNTSAGKGPAGGPLSSPPLRCYPSAFQPCCIPSCPSVQGHVVMSPPLLKLW